MDRKQEPHEVNRGRDSESTQSHRSSGLSGTQSKNNERTPGGTGDRVSGRPDAAGQGNIGQQSNVVTDGGVPSRQTSTAGEEKGQL
jgi:hypothetical protein